MIQKLRKQFILVAMCSTFAVLFIIIGSFNVANFMGKIRQKDQILEILKNNDGHFPEFFGQRRIKQGEEGKQPPGMGFPANKEGIPGDVAEKNNNMRFSRETPYETRFFTITLNANGELEEQDLGMIAAIGEDQAVEYAKAILRQYQKNGRTKGFYDEYRYLLAVNDGNYQIIFVDCSQDLLETRRGLIYSVSISLGGLLAVYFLVVFFSKKVFRPVEESYRKQKQFITDASHELKTPLTIISANVEVMEMESEESQWSQSIKKQVDRMVGLVEQMVTLSRMDEQKDLVCEKFSLSDAVKETAELYHPVAESSGKDFALDIEEGITFCGDEKKIRQMVGLLLDNSMKYASVAEKEDSQDGAVKPRIELSLKQKGKKIVFKVWNTVSSMEIGDQSILFERFYRPDSSRNSKQGGSGIGLSIVKSIVEAHKGKITAGSKDGKSIEFKAIF